MASAKSQLTETDLYEPLRDYLVAQGYRVRSEVKNCDITATRDDDLIIVELKKGLTVDLIAQATDRQRITDSVYVAVPRPHGGIYGKRWRGVTHVLRRLELGLIIVSFIGSHPHVEVVFHPMPFDRKRSSKKRHAVIREAHARTDDYNQGGSTRKKLMTAYRERAIHIACALEQLGELTPKQLRALGTAPNTTSILSNNFYGWFTRVARGVYALAPEGRAAMDEYAHVADHFRETVAQNAETVNAGE